MKRFPLSNYVVLMAMITLIFGVIYATVQQAYRTAANDPQIQIVRDINTKLKERKPVDNFFADTIDITQSLSPFVVLYDAAGNPTRSSGYLNSNMPRLPAGLFEYARSHGEYKVTWQPPNGARMAMVVVSSNASPVAFVAAGRSLQEVEVRQYSLIAMVFIGWIIAIILILLFAALQFYNSRQ